MKIRWTAQSVRYRIEPNEMEALLRKETVEAQFLGAWTATLEQGETTHLEASGCKVQITLSREDALNLAQPDQEGVYFQQDAPSLRYYVEKDYPCAHPRASEIQEKPSETFAPSEVFMQRKAEK